MGHVAGRRVCGATGQASVLLLAVLAVAMVGVLGVARLGALARDRAQARAGADAAALAAAAEGEPTARSLAEANGGVVERIERRPDGSVAVTVRVGAARATSVAARGAPAARP